MPGYAVVSHSVLRCRWPAPPDLHRELTAAQALGEVVARVDGGDTIERHPHPEPGRRHLHRPPADDTLKVAEMSADPVVSAVRRPVADTVATAWFDEVQVA